jgi:hypothetical protein
VPPTITARGAPGARRRATRSGKPAPRALDRADGARFEPERAACRRLETSPGGVGEELHPEEEV